MKVCEVQPDSPVADPSCRVGCGILHLFHDQMQTYKATPVVVDTPLQASADALGLQDRGRVESFSGENLGYWSWGQGFSADRGRVSQNNMLRQKTPI